MFQRGYVHFSLIGPTISKAKEELDLLATSKKPVTHLKDDLKKEGRLQLAEISMTESEEAQLKKSLEKYVDALRKNIEKRFPNIPVLTALSIFDPTAAPTRDSDDFRSYGNEEVELLRQHFFYGQDMIGLLPTEFCLKRIMSRYQEFSILCPHMTVLAEKALCIPVSNAWPERGASRVKIVKSQSRHRIKQNMPQSLLQISLNGPEPCHNEADSVIKEAVKTWQKQKNRRRLPGRQGHRVRHKVFGAAPSL